MKDFRKRDAVLFCILHQSVVAITPLRIPPHLVEVIESDLEAVILAHIAFLKVGLYPAVFAKPVLDLVKSRELGSSLNIQ